MSDRCEGCGRTIVWALDHDWKRIPLDPEPAVYDVAEFTPTASPPGVPIRPEVRATKNVRAMVSHYATCLAPAYSGSASRRTRGHSVPEPFGTPESALGEKRGHGGPVGAPPCVKGGRNPGSKQPPPTPGTGRGPIDPLRGSFCFDGEDG